MKRAVCLEYDGQKILAYTTGQSIITLCDFYAMGLPDQWWSLNRTCIRKPCPMERYIKLSNISLIRT